MSKSFPDAYQSKKMDFRRDAVYMMRNKVSAKEPAMAMGRIDLVASKSKELLQIMEDSGLIDNMIYEAPVFDQGDLTVDEQVVISGNPMAATIQKMRILNQQIGLKNNQRLDSSLQVTKAYKDELMETLEKDIRVLLEIQAY